MTKLKKVLMTGGVSILALGTSMGVGAILGQQAYENQLQPAYTNITEPTFLELVNRVRAQNNVAPLTEDPGLMASAQEKVADLDAGDYFSHDRPDSTSWSVNLIKHKPKSRKWGENLSFGNQKKQEIIDAWVKSPAHFEAMVDPAYNKFGWAITWDDSRKAVVAVNHFAQD